jgi:hypothetical protein
LEGRKIEIIKKQAGNAGIRLCYNRHDVLLAFAGESYYGR